MKTTEIFILETTGIAREREFVRVGVPCAIGSFKSTEGLQLMSPADKAQPVLFTILKKWQDGSIKWLLLDFAAAVPAGEQVVYRLAKGNDPLAPLVNRITVTKNSDYWRVETGAAEFVIDTKVFRPFIQVLVNKQDVLASGGATCLLGMVEHDLTPVVESIVTETEGPLRTIIRMEGHFGAEQKTPPRFDCRLHFFADSAHVQVDLTLLNPRAATHPGGLWDLGDSGSLLFKELSLQLPLAGFGKGRVHCSPEPDLPSLQFTSSDDMQINQESSGGKNWNSPVHRARDGDVHLRYSGYEVSVGGKRTASGNRATPVVWCGEGEAGVAAVIPNFWQEFPKAFSVNAEGMKVELFPGCASDFHELQGGEQKTTSFHLDFAASPDSLTWARSPLVAAPTPEACRNSGIFDDLPPIPGESLYVDLVDRFISVDELLTKREVVDEYGWRNFGELYADHEAVNHTGAQQFVSHYNNQYDGIGGMYRKFFASGNPQWGALASNLAQHVCDIDINHTDQDREEYNRGLFWHTDHYVDAGLSTHRSCSKEHLKVKDPRFCGGGPGAEHCYTTGLMYHYFQTGNPAFRKTVIDLTNWELCSLQGPATIFAALKKSLGYFSMLRGREKTPKSVFPKFPLTRGTGNALTACLDAHEVSGDVNFIDEAERLIRGSMHPDDDIASRNLLNAELAWSYTVLLLAVAKFINKKIEINQLDRGYEYARASLLAYAGWMLIHEYPYLEKPEILEYPNETWAAQDLRKSVIFYYAALYGPAGQVQAFKERAQFFYDAASSELGKHASCSLTRPVVLMLQNGWIGSKLSSKTTEYPSNVTNIGPMMGSISRKPTPYLTVGSVFARTASDFLRAAKHTSITREIAWLKARLN